MDVSQTLQEPPYQKWLELDFRMSHENESELTTNSTD